MNITKGLAYLLVIFLLLTGAGFMYHKQMEKETPTPTTPDVQPVSNDSTFVVQAQSIFQAAQQTWQADTQEEQVEKVYCNVEGCAKGVNGSFDYYYYVAINNTGNIVKFYVTNAEYQYGYVGEGLFIDAIANPTKISDVDPSQVISISSNM